MKPVSVSYAKNNLSALLKRVRSGHPITITDRGVPVAQLVPPPTLTGLPPQLAGLAERGLVKLPDHAPTTDWLKGALARPSGKLSNAAIDAIIDERRGEP